MFKKVVSLALCGAMVVSLSACTSETNGSTASTSSLNTEYIEVVRNAAQKLNDTYADYIISTVLEAPDGDTEYIEVIHDDESYTEYSIDSDGNYGTLSYGSSESITYALSDWLTGEGKYYLFSSDADGNSVVYYLPDNYQSYVDDRSMLYVNDILEATTSITEYDDLTIDLGEGEETFTCYKLRVNSECIEDILGVSSYGIYESILEEYGVDSNIGNLCSYYLEDLDMNLTFSDANVIVGIDNNGILKYMLLETGGLGTRLYCTKAVVATKNSNLRTTPDFSDAVSYADETLTDLADYVADYDTYDEALDALSAYYADDTEVDESLLQELETVEDAETEEVIDEELETEVFESEIETD